ncbi:MAG: prolipoprotein diacylglyceryl transferase [Desulfobacterium sp.]|nr:prolipoprotein diacylglyceryl transferase [Desulfobacterium sp.]
MLKYFLGFWINSRGVLFDIVNGAYYTIILTAIVIGCVFLYRKMIALGYERKRVLGFLLTFFCLALPLGYYSSRAANMFYYPVSYWNIHLFMDQLLRGTKHTFHACLIVPVIMTGMLIRLFRFRFWQVFDAIFMHIPLVHAIARVACLMAGCCWGHEICLEVFGTQVRFHNPIPLYESLFNLLLFFFLKRVFALEHEEKKVSGFLFTRIARIRVDGKIVALYLGCYSVYRFSIEYIRTNPVIAFGLTQAQLVMIGFFTMAGFIVLRSKLKRTEKTERTAIPSRRDCSSLAGFLVSYMLLVSLVVSLFYFNLIDWPFRGYHSNAKLYYNVFLYGVFAGLCSLLCFWLNRVDSNWLRFFRWKKISNVFWLGLLISCLYSVYLFQVNRWNLHGVGVVVPILLFSLLNAYSEEVVYRLACLTLLEKVFGVHVVANFFQAFLYGVTHYFIGGIKFAFFAFLYGMLLGTITKENKSIVPAMVCHFCIDIGNVGLPLLIVRNYFF